VKGAELSRLRPGELLSQWENKGSPSSVESKESFEEATRPRRITSTAVMERAIEVIGDRKDAFRWLGTPVSALSYETPIAAAATAEGEKAVLAVLGQLEQGVY
jgi:uncharacterized protein (DUF2384 family)